MLIIQLPVSSNVVTIVALKHKPNNIAKKTFGFGTPKRWDATQPLQAPVIGNGIPTNRTNPQK